MTAQEVRALVGMAVAAKDEINAVRFEDGDNELAHLGEILFVIGVMRTPGVRRMVPECDCPFVGGGGEVLFKPRAHGAVGRAVRTHGIERHKMDVSIIE